MIRHNAKCTRCGARVSILAASTRTSVALPADFNAIAWHGRTLFGPLAPVLVDAGGFGHIGHPNGGIARICVCGAALVLAPVRGIIRTDKKCDARCENATGHDCECACGGKHHGRAHSVAA